MREGYASSERRTEGCFGFGPGRISWPPKGALPKVWRVGDQQRYPALSGTWVPISSVDGEISGTEQSQTGPGLRLTRQTTDRLESCGSTSTSLV